MVTRHANFWLYNVKLCYMYMHMHMCMYMYYAAVLLCVQTYVAA